MTAASELKAGDVVRLASAGVMVEGTITDVTITVTVNRATAVMLQQDDEVEVLGTADPSEIPASPMIPAFVPPPVEPESTDTDIPIDFEAPQQSEV